MKSQKQLNLKKEMKTKTFQSQVMSESSLCQSQIRLRNKKYQKNKISKKSEILKRKKEI